MNKTQFMKDIDKATNDYYLNGKQMLGYFIRLYDTTEAMPDNIKDIYYLTKQMVQFIIYGSGYDKNQCLTALQVAIQYLRNIENIAYGTATDHYLRGLVDECLAIQHLAQVDDRALLYIGDIIQGHIIGQNMMREF